MVEIETSKKNQAENLKSKTASKGFEQDDFRLTTESFERFARFITQELGIKMSQEKSIMLKARLMRRLRHLEMGSLEEYQEYLFHSTHSEEERVHFINAVTTNKTEFFREAQHFDYLVQTVLPIFTQITQNRRKLTLWCAGCSSGEEAYTQAILLQEYARQSYRFDYQILATDISTRVLEIAQSGIYREEVIAPIPTALRHLYLMKSRDQKKHEYRVIPDLRERISFHRLNFMEPEYRIREMFDVIFFRNVAIYFDKPTQEAVIEKLCRRLRPGGFLFIGHSESLAGMNVPVESVSSSVFRKHCSSGK